MPVPPAVSGPTVVPACVHVHLVLETAVAGWVLVQISAMTKSPAVVVVRENVVESPATAFSPFWRLPTAVKVTGCRLPGQAAWGRIA